MSDSTSTPRPDKVEVGDGSVLNSSLRSEPLPLEHIEHSRCTNACPAGINVKAYVSLVAEGRYREALEVVRERCPLPGVCGRVCTHPCEEACGRGDFDSPVAIRSLKRFISDFELNAEPPPVPHIIDKSAKVAVIGSGPAGLTAAYDLRLAGYQVTVFESEEAAGGMLRYGIMKYRLPHDILDREVDILKRTGFDIKTNVKLGEDFTLEGLQKEGYKAIVLAVGAQLGKKLGVPGEKGQVGIEDALAFLRRAAAGERKAPGTKVVVIGGGSTAIEAARTAVRLGAEKVEIAYRRTAEEMPASEEEVHEAREEGVNIRFLVAPVKVVAGEGKLNGMEFVKCGLGEPDESGRRSPIPFPGSEFTIEADHILAAVSQQTDLSFLPPQKATEIMDGKWLIVDEDSLETKLKGVFAAGDVVTGPATVIEAIAAGHKVAESAQAYIEHGKVITHEPVVARGRAGADYRLPGSIPVPKKRQDHPTAHLEPGKEFEEVDLAFTSQQAMAEAQRCLRCGPCEECHSCVTTCGHRHVLLRPVGGDPSVRPAMVRAPSDLVQGLTTDKPITATLEGSASWSSGGATSKTDVEIVPVANYVAATLCRACGSCVEACPFHAIEMMSGEGNKTSAWIDPALCRGCNLCTGVCPTHAAISGTRPPTWWRAKMQEVFNFAASHETGKAPRVVLACESQSDNLSKQLGQNGHQVVLIDLRCAGELNSGMLIELKRQGAERIVVVGCGGDGCRYSTGELLAAKQVDQARSLLQVMGMDGRLIATDFTCERARELVEAPLDRFLTMSGFEPTVGNAAGTKQEVRNV